jgi:5-methyltetrahydrofolate--homocysteine methyltransferase
VEAGAGHSVREAAEYRHKRMREELGIGGEDAKSVRELFGQKYRGSRYGFGYPACPNLEDPAKLWTILQPERIGVTCRGVPAL